MEDLVPNNGEN